MAERLVQVSIDEQLLERIDGDPETHEKGRSAFIRAAVEWYFAAKERAEIEKRLVRAYAGQADVMLGEIDDYLGAQMALGYPDDPIDP